MIGFDFTQQPGLMLHRECFSEPVEPLVSIITPFYNAGEHFEQTFNCVINQTFPWFEWIIVNDGSTNKEDVALLEALAEKDKRIKVFHQENVGVPKARNACIEHSVTNYLVPLDADDLISPQYIECTYWGLQMHPEASWCYTDSCAFGIQELVWIHPFDAEQLKTENFLVVTAMICKSAAMAVGGYIQEKCPYNEDWRFWLNLLAMHFRPVHVGGIHFWYRRADKSMLSESRCTPERIAFNEKMIGEAAKMADGTIAAIEFPRSSAQQPFGNISFRKIKRASNPSCNAPTVLWLIPWMEMGGADKFNLDAIRGLESKGYHNCVITTYPGENSWRQRFEAMTDEVFCLPEFLEPNHFIDFISAFLQSRKVDVLICSNSYDGYYMLPWLRMHFPDLAIVDCVHMEEWYWRNGGYARVSGNMEGIVEKTWVTNSATRDVIVNCFGRDPANVDLLYIGVDDQEFCRQACKGNYLHQKLGLANSRPIVLFPCRIHPQKRPFMMLEIAQQVAKQMPEVAFVVVGDGPQENELKQAVIDRGLCETVYLIGRTDELPECFADSELTLICSIKEGLAIITGDSCSMGVPVISSDVGGQHDLVGSDVGALIPLLQDEATALDARSFPPEEVKNYVNAIVQILQDDKLRQEMGKRARRKIEEEFSTTKMIEKLDRELTYLCTTDDAIQARRKKASMLQTIPGIVSDYLTMYQAWQKQESECSLVWMDRCYFQDLLNQARNEAEQYKTSLEKEQQKLHEIQTSLEDEQQKLHEIYISKSWRLLQKYRHLIGEKALGRAVRKAGGLAGRVWRSFTASKEGLKK